MNILRTAASTNQVKLRVKHSHPPLSSVEYQKYLFEEKSTDDDEDHRHRSNHQTNNDAVRMRRTSRRQHHLQQLNSSHESTIQGLDASADALQALLNSRFQLTDLIDLLKKSYPKYFSTDQNRELLFHQQLSETNSGKIKNSN